MPAMPRPSMPTMAPAQRKRGLAPPNYQAPSTLVATCMASPGESTSTTETKVTETSETTVTTEITEITQVAENSEVASEVTDVINSCGLEDLDEAAEVDVIPAASWAAEVEVISSTKTSETGAKSSKTTSVAEAGVATSAVKKWTSTFAVAQRPLQSPQPAQAVTRQRGPSLLKHGVAEDKLEDKLVIGIDFGTTYTGIAYALTSDPTKIKVAKEWPGRAIRGRNDILKIPTIIKYAAEPNGESNKFNFDWGYKVGEDAQGVIRGFKLGLDPRQRDFWTAAVGIPAEDDIVHSHEETAKVEGERLDRGTVEIVADYLGAVYKHALAKIYKAELPVIAALPKEFVITVPAIWSDAAKNATLRAARLAHPDLSLVSPGDLVKEPEAAALCMQNFQNRGLEKGDTFVLCDAGGGTVDLISYQITLMKPRMRVKEVVAATGGAVGSMMINNGFERYLRKILGDEVLSKMKEGNGAPFHSVMRDFEQRIKRSFKSAETWDDGGDEDDEDDEGVDDAINISGVDIEDDPENNIRGNTLTITGGVLDDIFDPLVTATEKLVREQIEGVKQKTGRPPKWIILVGGFGASPYLSRRLKEMVRFEDIEVVQPHDAQAAVVKGAVLYKMPNTAEVISNIAQTSLGVQAAVHYDPLTHPEDAADHRVYDANEGVMRVPKMTWFIIKGDELDRTGSNQVRFPCYRDLPLDYRPEDLVFEDELEESDEVLPPQFPWQGKGVKHKCVVTSDLRGMDAEGGGQLLVRRTAADGSEYYALQYELVMKVQSAFMTFAVECKGRSFGMADIKFQ